MDVRRHFDVHTHVLVLELGLVSAVEVSVELEVPVATGTRSPIFNVAFCPSTERSCGRCRMVVLLSVNIMATLIEGIEP